MWYDPTRSSARTGWLLTFADLVALMLTFFVMLFSMSAIDAERWRSFAGALAGRPAPAQDDRGGARPAERNLPLVAAPYGVDLDYLAPLLRDRLAEAPELAGMAVQRFGDSVVLSLPAALLFPPGTAEVGAAGRSALARLGAALGNVRNRIQVVGHTDPSLPAAPYGSNWELSLVRAMAVADALRRAGYSGDVPALGAGDGRYRHLAPSLPVERRMALAQRVDIVVHDRRGD